MALKVRGATILGLAMITSFVKYKGNLKPVQRETAPPIAARSLTTYIRAGVLVGKGKNKKSHNTMREHIAMASCETYRYRLSTEADRGKLINPLQP